MASFPVELGNGYCRVLPYFFGCQLVFTNVRRAIVGSPLRAVDGRDYSTNFQSQYVLQVGRATYPVAFQLLADDGEFDRYARAICVFLTVFVHFERIFRRLYRSNWCPAIATYPGVFFAIRAFVLQVCMFSVPVVGSNFFIMRGAVNVGRVFVRFLRMG